MMERLTLGIIAAVLLLQILESTVGKSAANWFAFVLLAGIALYQRDGLIKFSNDIQSRLAR